MITDPTAADLRVALADQLAQQGLLTDPGWRDAFAAVPREAFVPFYFEPCRGRLVEDGQQWRDGVYADDAHSMSTAATGSSRSAPGPATTPPC